MILVFGDCRLDLDRRELWRGPDLVHLEPQVFDLLAYLVHNRHRVVSKDDLLRDVWGGRIVSESALAARIHAARRAVGDDGTAQRLIRSFVRKGVRFVGDASELPEKPAWKAPQAPCSAAAVQCCPSLAGLPSIAVFPFANFTSDHNLAYFAGGLAEEITIALSRIRWLVVVAGNAKPVTASGYLDTNEAARELGARYSLAGAMSGSGHRLRMAVHLTETESGGHLWADHFDGSLEDQFSLQDKVASNVAGLIEPLLQAFEGARAVNCPSCDLSAYQTYLRAFAMHASARNVPTAIVLLEKAITRDPGFGPALALAANCYMRLAMDQISNDPAVDTRKGAEYAWRALEIAPDDPNVLANAARPLAYAGENIGTTIAMMDRALALNPNFARGWYIRGFLKYWAGDPEVAIKEVEKAQRLSPRGHFGTAQTVIGNALIFSERFEEAVPKINLAIQEDPSFPPNYRLLAGCYAHLGRLDEARAAIARLPETAPLIMAKVERSYRAMFRDPAQRELALWGVRTAVGERCKGGRPQPTYTR